MAEAHRAAFAADIEALERAVAADDEAAGGKAAFALAKAVFDLLDRAVDALERIAASHPGG